MFGIQKEGTGLFTVLRLIGLFISFSAFQACDFVGGVPTDLRKAKASPTSHPFSTPSGSTPRPTPNDFSDDIGVTLAPTPTPTGTPQATPTATPAVLANATPVPAVNNNLNPTPGPTFPTPLSSDGVSVTPMKKGCLQGSLVDGLYGTPLHVPRASANEGIFVLVRNTPIPAINIGANQSILPDGSPSSAAPILFDSEFLACNIPLDETFPVFAYINGYLPFEGMISISSSINAANEGHFIMKAEPTLVAHIRVFPLGTVARNFVFKLTNNGFPVSGATVVINTAQTSFVGLADSFISPVLFRGGTLIATTDSVGNATFLSQSLSLGLSYSYTVIPPNNSFLSSAKGTFVYGLYPNTSPNPPGANDLLPIELESTIPGLVLLSTSLESTRFDDQGRIELVFNRNIEFVSETIGSMTATLISQDLANPPLCNGSNGPNCTNIELRPRTNTTILTVSDQVEGQILGNILTLTPKFRAAPPAASSANPTEKLQGVQYGLDGVNIRPTGGVGTANEKNLGTIIRNLGFDPIVYFYQ